MRARVAAARRRRRPPGVFSQGSGAVSPLVAGGGGGVFPSHLRRYSFHPVMDNTPKCPKCGSEFTYADGDNIVCPDCSHEWSKHAVAAVEVDENAPKVYKDANGNLLADGDTVVLIKDLKLKGASRDLKCGTKVRNIRLVDGDHDIDCRIEGLGAVQLKSEFVRKA